MNCITCALEGYSAINCGEGKTLPKQQPDMYNFYCVKVSNLPSQIKLLSEASYSYRTLFDGERRNDTKNYDDHNTLYKYNLKAKLMIDPSKKYYASRDINELDLGKITEAASN